MYHVGFKSRRATTTSPPASHAIDGTVLRKRSRTSYSSVLRRLSDGEDLSSSYLVACAPTAKMVDNGWLLEGTEKTFDGLVMDLYDEVEFEMQPASKLKHLRRLIAEISPEGDF